jgi:hypothetical protein
LVAHIREECRLSVFENRAIRRIFGPKRDERRGEWRKLHNAKFTELYCSPNIIRVIKSRKENTEENLWTKHRIKWSVEN